MQPPAARVQHGEEVDERRHHRALPAVAGPQQRHLRDEVTPVALGRAHQRGDRSRRVGDVRVREQDVARLAGAGSACRGVGALGHGPHLAGPVRRRLAALHDQQLAASGHADRQRAGDPGGAVGALVIDQHDQQLARVVLGEQAGQRLGQDRRLVTGWHDHGHGWPLARRPGHPRQPLVGPPEPPVAGQEVEPPQQREQRNDRGRR
jgi:hypothetical protein